nr:FtsX-like permease family protein [Candidatus Sigynarchaeota archaeon]
MFRFSAKNVFRKKTVAFLSSLGIAFGLMLQFVLGGFSAGVIAQVQSNFKSSLGVVQVTELGQAGASSRLPQSVLAVLLASNFSQDILAYNPKVELAPKFTVKYSGQLKNAADSLIVIGVNQTLDVVFEGPTSKIQNGTAFSPNTDEIILDSRLLEFNTNFSKAIGDMFKVWTSGTSYINMTITGIYKQADSGAPSFVPRAYYAYTDIRTAWRLIGLAGDPNGTYTGIDLQFPPVSNNVTKEYIDKIKALSDAGAFGTTSVDASSPGQFAEGISNTLGILNTFTSVISFITLLAGAMAIIVAQLNSISARMKEFAILKSTGWKNRHIFKDVIYESLILGVLGAIIGLVLGVCLIAFISNAGGLFGTGASILITPVSVLQLVGFALGIGIIGGLYPAIKAARVRPVTLLKGE